MLKEARRVLVKSAVSCVAATMLSAAFCVGASAADLTPASLRLKWLPQAQFMGYYVAKAKGYYANEGIDLTIVPVPTPAQEPYTAAQPLHACYLPAGERFHDSSIDMGTGFDCFHELSHPGNLQVGQQQRTHRLLLRTLMDKHGFQPYEKEWWHFTLRNEPFPDTYFDFPVR